MAERIPARTGVTGDYTNAIVYLDIKYHVKGLDAVTELLREHPIPIFEERKAELLAKSNEPEWAASIEGFYAITEANADAVKWVNMYARRFNLSVAEQPEKRGRKRQMRLTDRLFRRLYERMMAYIE